MRLLCKLARNPHLQPLGLLVLVIAGFVATNPSMLSVGTGASTLETFATVGPVALGLGLTMLMGEFDLSVAGIFGMAGCIAVLSGVAYPWLGLFLATGAGAMLGAVQGLIIHRLRLASIGVTLGGLLISIGVAYVLTGSSALFYDNMGVAMWMGTKWLDLLSARTAAAIVLFASMAVLVGFTRPGRDLIAAGSDRQAALVAGVDVGGLMVAVFAFSGAAAALAGVLLSYSLASASPAGLSDVLVPAATAAILGGVSLGGGAGRPLGIAAGVLVLSVMRAGFNALGAEPWISEAVMAMVLLIVAALDAPAISQSLRRLSGLQPP